MKLDSMNLKIPAILRNIEKTSRKNLAQKSHNTLIRKKRETRNSLIKDETYSSIEKFEESNLPVII